MNYIETEVRFLDVNVQKVVGKLRELGAVDKGEHLLDERIIYDTELTWRDGAGKILRLRTVNGCTELAYKERKRMSADGVEEIEFTVSDVDAAEALLERLGYKTFRHQQKRRHSFLLNTVQVDIDTWPHVPTYVELEGSNEQELKDTAALLELDWRDVELRSPRTILEETYAIPVGTMKWFTFDRFE